MITHLLLWSSSTAIWQPMRIRAQPCGRSLTYCRSFLTGRCRFTGQDSRWWAKAPPECLFQGEDSYAFRRKENRNSFSSQEDFGRTCRPINTSDELSLAAESDVPAGA